jgi:hypothetical protein
MKRNLATVTRTTTPGERQAYGQCHSTRDYADGHPAVKVQLRLRMCTTTNELSHLRLACTRPRIQDRYLAGVVPLPPPIRTIWPQTWMEARTVIRKLIIARHNACSTLKRRNGPAAPH